MSVKAYTPHRDRFRGRLYRAGLVVFVRAGRICPHPRPDEVGAGEFWSHRLSCGETRAVLRYCASLDAAGAEALTR
jgi:hypothetical protein